MNKEKLMKTAKGLDIVAKITSIFTEIGIIGTIVGMVLIALGAYDIHSGSNLSINIGEVDIYLKESYANQINISKTSLLVTLASALLILLIIWYVLRIARQILKPMREGNPFDVSVSGKIRTLAKVQLFGGLGVSLLKALASSMSVMDFNVMDIFNQNVVERISINYTFDLNFLFIAFILYLLSYVFEYGEELQQLSDETL